MRVFVRACVPETNRKWRQKEQERWFKHHSDVAGNGEEDADADGEAAKRGGTEAEAAGESAGEGQEKRSINAVPDVEVRERSVYIKPILYLPARQSLLLGEWVST